MGELNSHKTELDYIVIVRSENMKERVILYADEGMVLTDGEIFGKTVYLADDKDKTSFTEITDEEYEKILAEEEGGE